MSFVVVGAGPTGVEMAGAISEIARITLVKDFRHIDPAQAKVILIDAVDSKLVTTIASSANKAREIPDAWYQRDFLPHVDE